MITETEIESNLNLKELSEDELDQLYSLSERHGFTELAIDLEEERFRRLEKQTEKRDRKFTENWPKNYGGRFYVVPQT